MEALWWILLALLGICGSALCSGAEIGLYTVNRVRLNLAMRDPARSARGARRLARELERPERALSTLLVSNTFFNQLGALGVAGVLFAMGLEGWAAVGVNALVLTPVLVVFAETTPKELFRGAADRWMPALSGPLSAVRVLLTVTRVLPLIDLFARLAGRLAGVSRGGPIDARDRLGELLKEGALHGVLSDAQADLLDRALQLKRLTVESEMQAWRRVARVSDSMPMDRVFALMASRPHGRYPVTDGTGRVVGVLSRVDALRHRDADVRRLMAPALELDRALDVMSALTRLEQHGARLGVVVDDRRRPIGVVTAKDLVEPMTGDLDAW